MEQIQFTKELKAKWLAALRSGEYKQGHARLVGGDAYCCLGVLGTIAGIVEHETCLGYSRLSLSSNTHRDSVVEGLSSGQQSYLMGLNDDERWDFLQIADYIETNIPAVDEVSGMNATL